MTPKERTGSTGDARIHIKKANDYFAAASSALVQQTYDPAVSNAVISGINSADVICLVALGRRSDDSNHEASVALLGKAGAIGAEAAPILARLLPKKNVSQYRTARANERDAQLALDDAEALLELMTRAAADLP